MYVIRRSYGNISEIEDPERSARSSSVDHMINHSISIACVSIHIHSFGTMDLP